MRYFRPDSKWLPTTAYWAWIGFTTHGLDLFLVSILLFYSHHKSIITSINHQPFFRTYGKMHIEPTLGEGVKPLVIVAILLNIIYFILSTEGKLQYEINPKVQEIEIATNDE